MTSEPIDRRDLDDPQAQVAWVRRLALAIVRDQHQADDLAQDAWLAYLHHRPSEGPGLVGWFRRVLENLARGDARRGSTRGATTLDAEGTIGTAEDPSQALVRLETIEALARVVRTLPEPYRTVVLLRWFEGLAPVEIARRTHAPLRTVHTRTSRALSLLRAELDRSSSCGRLWIVAWAPLVPKSSLAPLLLLATQSKLKLAAALAVLTLLGIVGWISLKPETPTSPEVAVLRDDVSEPVHSRVEEPAFAEASERVAITPLIQADAPVALTVQVTDDRGIMTRFAVRLEAASRAERLRGLENLVENHAGGRASLPIEADRYVVQVQAPFHLPLVLGPFEKASGARQIEARLERVAGITGRVLDREGPLEGATLSLHEEVREGRRTWAESLLVRSTAQATAPGRSDAEGYFSLDLQRAGSFYLRAVKTGSAPAELGPFMLDPRVGKDGLELYLGAGGSIEGNLLISPTVDLAAGESGPTLQWASAGDGGMMLIQGPLQTTPIRVAATRFDAFPVIVEPDSHGHFRFDGLTPGPWLVLRLPQVLGNLGEHSDDGPGMTPTDSNCEVRERTVTWKDIDLRAGSGTTQLLVRAELGGIPCEGWKLRAATTAWRSAAVDEDVPLGAEGTAELECVSGPAVLHLVSKLEEHPIHIREQIVLAAGPAQWIVSIPVGDLEGSSTPFEDSDGRTRNLELRWSQGGRDALLTARVEPDGTFHVHGLPAGEWRTGGLENERGVDVSFSVPIGGVVRVDLAR